MPKRLFSMSEDSPESRRLSLVCPPWCTCIEAAPRIHPHRNWGGSITQPHAMWPLTYRVPFGMVPSHWDQIFKRTDRARQMKSSCNIVRMGFMNSYNQVQGWIGIYIWFLKKWNWGKSHNWKALFCILKIHFSGYLGLFVHKWKPRFILYSVIRRSGHNNKRQSPCLCMSEALRLVIRVMNLWHLFKEEA